MIKSYSYALDETMRWVNEDGSTRSGPWQEPPDPRSTVREEECPKKYVWAVPTQEGMALQLNSMLSVLTLGARLGRVAVVMPLLAGGPHYRSEVAARKLGVTERMSQFVNLTAFGRNNYEEFDDVYGSLPRSARCISCAGRPPPHVRCVRGWDYEWCDRSLVERRRTPKCSLRLARHRDECGACVFSVGFTPGLQRAEPSWYQLRDRLRFTDVYENAALNAARWLFQTEKYVALQMRRGDKAEHADNAGLTVDSVLVRTKKLAKDLPVLVATDDRSNATLSKVRAAGFFLVESDQLPRFFRDNTVPSSVKIASYLVDILLCVNSHIFVGTSHKTMKSKQLELIKSMRRGRRINQRRPIDIVLT